jgi:hypothetical protein
MPPLSTSNSEKTVSFHLRVFSPGLLLLLLVLASCEMALRTDVVREVLPLPNRYYQPGVEARLRALQKTITDEGGIDLLFVGSSVVRTDFRPFLFDERVTATSPSLGAGSSINFTSFNGGFSDMTPSLVPFYLEHFWLVYSSPRIILHGIRYPELLDPATPETYIHFQTGDFESLWLSDNPLDKLRLSALESSQLFYYQGLLNEILLSFPATPSRGFPIDGRGYNEPGLTLTEAKAQGRIGDISEFAYSEPLEAAAMSVGLAGLAQSVALAQAQGIQFMLVNIPEHGDKFLLEADGRARYAFYLEQLQAFADAHDIEFVDITNGDPTVFQDDVYFSDYHHMSGLGAEKFTQDLADYLILHEDLLKGD